MFKYSPWGKKLVTNTLIDQRDTLVGSVNLPTKLKMKIPHQKTLFKEHPIPLVGDKTYVIDMKSSEVDSYLYLFGPRQPDGSYPLDPAAWDDDSGGYPDARIQFHCLKGGDYKLSLQLPTTGRLGNITWPCMKSNRSIPLRLLFPGARRAKKAKRSPVKNMKPFWNRAWFTPWNFPKIPPVRWN